MDLFDLYAKISLDSSDYDKGIAESSDKANGFASKIGNGLKKAAEIGAAAITAAATGIAALTKASLDEYANYEQLVGGVETLFKTSAGTVEKYAESAYKTAGLSANEYMETVTSFSASLLQSLGGDTAAASEYANTAITDMSDNANKMGSSMESIQTAYQGFAKQNYTMLDNLKIGYGGTKSEMERLIADANALNAAQGNYTQYTIDSYADVVSAIHDVQTEIGITGTTAKEAKTTIQGSVASMKSAWKNLLTGIADPTQDIGKLIDNLVESILTVGDNIIPRISELLPRISEGLLDLINSLVPEIPGILANLLPSLIEGATALVNGIVTALPELFKVVASALPQLIDAIMTILPALVDAGLQIVISLAYGIADNIEKIVETIVDVVLQIVDILTNPDTLLKLVDAALKIILGLAKGLIDAIPRLIEAIPTIITNLIDAILGAIPLIIDAGIELLMALVDALPEIIDGIVKAIPKIITGIINAVMDNLPKIIDAGIRLFLALIENLPTIIIELVKAIPQIIKALIDGFAGGFDKFAEIGGQLIEGLWQGISAAGTWLWDQISGFFGGIVDGVKDFLGIHSPSKVFSVIGQYSAEGVGVGFDDEFADVKKDIEGQLDFSKVTADIGVSTKMSATGEQAQERQPVMLVVQLQSGIELARQMYDDINQLKRIDGQQRGAVAY